MGRLDELGSFPAEFSLRVAERWQEVEDAVERWRGLGIAATREEADAIYCEAVIDATGRSRLEVYDD
jgi:hypothetical protein